MIILEFPYIINLQGEKISSIKNVMMVMIQNKEWIRYICQIKFIFKRSTLYLFQFHKMGCGVSSDEPETPQARYNPIKSHLNDQQKEKLVDHIDSDDLPSLAVDMEECGASPNTEISDKGMKWMLTHLCCRWDADDCLQFLLKQFFAENPKQYIDFVNAPTTQGYTCLHLCSIWMSQKCLKVLLNYGGLNLHAKDVNNRTPFMVACDYKSKENIKLLNRYQQLNVSFLTVQTERLLSGEIISDGLANGQRKKVERQVTINPQIHKMAGNLFLHEQEKEKQAREKKKKIEEEMQRIQKEKKTKQEQQNKIQKQNQVKRQSAWDHQLKQKDIQEYKQSKESAVVSDFLDNFQKWQNEKNQKEEIEKRQKEEHLRKQQEQYKKQQEELKKANEEIQRLQNEKMERMRQQQQKKTDQMMQQRQAQLKQRLKAQKNAIIAIKRLQNKQKAQKPKATPRIAQQNKNGLPSDFPPEIVEKYEQAKAAGIFVDNQFPAQNSSMGRPQNAKLKNLTANLKWLRPCDIFKGQYKLFDGIDQNDIKQGSLGVCYMLATISALAKNPENIKKIFVFHDLKLGFYVLKLFKHGKPTYIAIDDLIPCNSMTKSPLFTKPIGNQVWVLLLEKAWAKMVGNYLKAEAMTPDHIMEDLSGAPGFGAWFKDTEEGAKLMAKHIKLAHIIVLTSGNEKFQGIVANHAYTLLDAFQHNSALIFKIRNPWGRFEWNGQYGEKSSLWTEELKKKVQFKGGDDGTFFLSQNQLTTVFVYFSINEIHQQNIYSHAQFQSGQNEDLCYTFKLTKESHFNLRVSQPFDRMLDDKNYSYSPMALEIGKIESDKKVKFLSEGHKKSYFGAKSVHAFEQISQKLDAGQYFVRVHMLWKNISKYNTGVIGIYCKQPITLQKLQPQMGIKRMQQLFFDFSLSKNKSPSGLGFYKIVIMKGQFVFVAQVQKEGQYKACFNFQKQKMKQCITSIGKVSESSIQVTLNKDQPGIGTAKRTNPSQGGTTGPTSILISSV